LVNAEWKRVESVRAARVALDSAARAASRRYFSGPAEAEKIIGKATAREWRDYLLESSMTFDGFNKDGGTK
jgi:hypothetical protein